MATTPQYEEGYHNQEPIFESSGDSELCNNDDDGICNVSPGDTRHSPNIKTPGSNNNPNITPCNEPGALPNGEATTITTATTTTGSEPSVNIEAEEKEAEESSYMNSIHLAIRSLQQEIYKSQQEQKHSEALMEQQFAEIIQQIINKKSQLMYKMNIFYNEQKEKSLQRIQELKNELSEKELEIQIEREKQFEQQQRIKAEEEEKQKAAAAQALANNNNDREPEVMSNYERLSIFATKIAENASKAKSKASLYIESWRNSNKDNNIARPAQYCKHDKIRLFVPRKELSKLIDVDIKLSTEWWDAFKLNHIVYNTYDADLWRTSAVCGGWYNAFGSIKVRKSQSKRWNIKICQRIKQERTAAGKQKPADVVVGVIQSDKRKSLEKQCGFWLKPFEGFGLYGWNGKIFHRKTRGKVYGIPFYVGSVIGIELDMYLTPGMDLSSKTKAKTNVKSLSKTNIGRHGGVVKFYVDDEDLGIAFYDLDLNKEYSLAVALNSDVYSLQLMD